MAYLSDAISTIIGASLGVSTVVTYIESATGVRDGGRTGLTACFSGLFFLMCLPFSPWLSQVPALASGPALVVVGVFMMEAVKGIDWCARPSRATLKASGCVY
jgi:AGZA family xanthine/uracil permease-like MFS transporter